MVISKARRARGQRLSSPSLGSLAVRSSLGSARARARLYPQKDSKLERKAEEPDSTFAPPSRPRLPRSLCTGCADKNCDCASGLKPTSPKSSDPRGKPCLVSQSVSQCTAVREGGDSGEGALIGEAESDRR